VKEAVGRIYWLSIFRGAFVLLFGILSLLSTLISSGFLIEIFAFYTFLAGCLLIFFGLSGKPEEKNSYIEIFTGLANLVIGSLLLSFPEYADRWFPPMISIWAFIEGFFQLFIIHGKKFLTILDLISMFIGLVAINLGILCLSYPMFILQQWSLVIGSTGLLLGACILITAIKRVRIGRKFNLG